MAETLSYIIMLFLFDFPLLALGYYFGFEFVAISLVATIQGRKLKVFLSRNVFFCCPVLVGGVLLSAYGCLIAIGVSELIAVFHPSPWIKWFFGFGLGVYLTQPDFALATRLTDDPAVAWRREVAGVIPLISYIAFLLLVPQPGWNSLKAMGPILPSFLVGAVCLAFFIAVVKLHAESQAEAREQELRERHEQAEKDFVASLTPRGCWYYQYRQQRSQRAAERRASGISSNPRPGTREGGDRQIAHYLGNYRLLGN